MRFTEINVKEDVKLSEFYNKRIAISFSNEKPLRFQIPRMYMPFGVSGFTPEIGPTKWNIDFSMKGWNEENNYIHKFYNFVREVENHVINYVKENSVVIFGTQNIDFEKIFNSNIKEDFDREHKFRVKLDTDQKNFIKPRIFDVNEVDVTREAEKGLYSKHSGVSMVELNSVYFLNKKFGLTWKISQLKIYEPQRLHGFQFNIDDGPEEDETEISGFQFQI